jgi:hypothetical protein
MHDNFAKIGSHIIQNGSGYVEPFDVPFYVSGDGVSHQTGVLCHTNGRVVKQKIAAIIYLVQMVQHWRKVIPLRLFKVTYFEQAPYHISRAIGFDAAKQRASRRDRYFRVVCKNPMDCKFRAGEHRHKPAESQIEIHNSLGFVGRRIGHFCHA